MDLSLNVTWYSAGSLIVHMKMSPTLFLQIALFTEPQKLWVGEAALRQQLPGSAYRLHFDIERKQIVEGKFGPRPLTFSMSHVFKSIRIVSGQQSIWCLKSKRVFGLIPVISLLSVLDVLPAREFPLCTQASTIDY